MKTKSPIYGLMAEFDDPNALVLATERARHEGYRRMDAYSPFPIEELHEALGEPPSRLPLIVLVGGLVGCIGGFALQYWVSAVANPWNIGGRPLFSWPAFIPMTFECTILVAALSAVLGMLALNGLPMPYHPVFNVSRFALASRNRFFLCIEAKDAQFDLEKTRTFLQTLHPREVPPLRTRERITTLNAELAEPAEHIFSAHSAVSALIVVTVVLAGSACRQDMHDQPKYIPLRGSTFFADGRSARPPVPGTVARDQLHDDTLLYTGKVDGADATVFPFPVDENVMARGQERYDIYCSPCHGRTGAGDGMVVRRGYRPPPSLHVDRLRLSPAGHFFDVMTTGFGAMPDYAAQIGAEDRWAIVAYIRALQLSEHATVADVPADKRGALQ